MNQVLLGPSKSCFENLDWIFKKISLVEIFVNFFNTFLLEKLVFFSRTIGYVKNIFLQELPRRDLSKHIREKRAVIWTHLKNLREIFLDFSAEPSEIGREYFFRTIGDKCGFYKKKFLFLAFYVSRFVLSTSSSGLSGIRVSFINYFPRINFHRLQGYESWEF